MGDDSDKVVINKNHFKIVVISGPSGVGKTTLCNKLVAQEPRLQACITATTRPPRPGEINGKDYYFVSRETFKQWLENDELVEYIELFNNFYGTPKKSIDEIIKKGKYPLLRIDVQGAQQLRKLGYQGVFIFILPPDLATLEQRLRKRSDTIDNELLKERLKKALEEISYKDEYDFQVVNDNLDEAISYIKTILNKHLFS